MLDENWPCYSNFPFTAHSKFTLFRLDHSVYLSKKIQIKCNLICPIYKPNIVKCILNVKYSNS